MLLTPYPLIYTPKNVSKPACCPHGGPIDVLPGKGPDVVITRDGDNTVVTGGGGRMWGGGYHPESSGWKPTPAGWWLQLLDHKPQHCIRLQAHPRVRQWVSVVGALPDHTWQIPVLLTHDQGRITSALDGIFDGQQFSAGDLSHLQQQLLAVRAGVGANNYSDEELQTATLNLAIDLLAVGQWIDRDFLAVSGWLSESLMLRAILIACGEHPHD